MELYISAIVEVAVVYLDSIFASGVCLFQRAKLCIANAAGCQACAHTLELAHHLKHFDHLTE